MMDKKFTGALLGLAVGDAMGGPLEFMSANQIQIKHGTVSSMIGGGWLQLRPGQYTEDATLMVALAESLADNKRVDVEDLARRYLQWYRTSPKDGGRLTRAVLALLDQGESPVTASERGERETGVDGDENDPLPVCVPLALAYHDSPERLMEETARAARVTHCNKKVVSAAVTLNLVISRILNGESERRKIFEQVGSLLDENELGLYNMLPEISGKEESELRSSPRVQDTLETAMWALWKTSSYRDAVVKVINIGGDSGSVGAVTGALAGARYGEDGIPEQWLRVMEDRKPIAGLAARLGKLAGQADRG